MPSLDDVAAQHYTYQSVLIDELLARIGQWWATMQPGDVMASWQTVAPAVADLVTVGQYTAAAAADGYVQAAMQAQGTQPAPAGVVPGALAGVASDGRALGGLLLSAPLTVLEQIAGGAAAQVAMDAGLASLLMHAGTQIADAGRAADQVAMAATPQARSWVRMIEPGACSRCAILAGREYKWDASFLRHPRCRCRAIPKAEDSGDLTTDPKAYFDSLSPSEQDRIFTQAGAEAIRQGADIGQVVNARRGMDTATQYGRTMQVTREGVTRHGLAGQRELIQRNGGIRLMPEEIFRVANDRADAVRLLRAYGYIL